MYTAAHRGGRHRAEPAAGAPTTDTSGPVLTDADRADPPEMYGRLGIAAQWGRQAGGLETNRLHMQLTSMGPQSTLCNEHGGAAEARTRIVGVCTYD